jgi:hypothetical protein
MKEKKMKEGTWTVEKPQRRTPPSKDKRTTRCSEGVKRPHSDSSTPPLETQQPKNPRNTKVQTEVYKEAVTGIKRAIIHRRNSEAKLDQSQANIIQEKLLDVNPVEEIPPQFLQSRFAQGVYWINCANETTKEWLMRAIKELGEPWERAGLTVVDSKDLPKRPRVIVRIPDTSEVDTVLNTMDWLVMSRKIIGKEQTLALSIDPNSYKALARSKFKASWGLGRIIFRTLEGVKKHPQTESSTSKSSSQ